MRISIIYCIMPVVYECSYSLLWSCYAFQMKSNCMIYQEM